MTAQLKHIKIESHGPGWQGKITDADTGEEIDNVVEVFVSIHPLSPKAEATLTFLSWVDDFSEARQEETAFDLIDLDITAIAQRWHTRLGELHKLRYLASQAALWINRYVEMGDHEYLINEGKKWLQALETIEKVKLSEETSNAS